MEHYSNQRIYFNESGDCVIRSFHSQYDHHAAVALHNVDVERTDKNAVNMADVTFMASRGAVATAEDKPKNRRCPSVSALTTICLGNQAGEDDDAPKESFKEDVNNEEQNRFTIFFLKHLFLFIMVGSAAVASLVLLQRDENVPNALMHDGSTMHSSVLEKRYDFLFNLVVESNVTSARDLSTPFTPPNLSLMWLAETGWQHLNIPLDNSVGQEQTALELYALAVLFHSTSDLGSGGNGTIWLRSDNWLSPFTSVCDWYGVACESVPILSDIPNDIFSFNRNYIDLVSSIELSNNGLQGSIPGEISTLQSLRFLKLDKNKLMGTLPNSIGTLHNLGEYITHYD